MNIIYVDDEQIQREKFRLTVKGMEGMESLKLFGSSGEAYEWAKEHPVDVAFLDIEMPQMNGLELTRKLKELNRDTCVIVTDLMRCHRLIMRGIPADALWISSNALVVNTSWAHPE